MQDTPKQEQPIGEDEFADAIPGLDFYLVAYRCTKRQEDGSLKSLFGRSYVQFTENKVTPRSMRELELLLRAQQGAEELIIISLSKL